MKDDTVKAILSYAGLIGVVWVLFETGTFEQVVSLIGLAMLAFGAYHVFRQPSSGSRGGGRYEEPSYRGDFDDDGEGGG